LRAFDAIDAGPSAAPVVDIRRYPQQTSHVVADMQLEGADRILRAGGAEWIGVARAKRVIGRKQPEAGEGIDDELAGASGIANLRLEGPAVGADVDQPGGIVLAGRRHGLDAGAEERSR